MERFGSPEAAGLIGAWLADDDHVETYEELVERCPPERVGLTPGAYVAIVGPLFGEFE